MKVLVNNKEVKTGATTLSQLIEELALPMQGIAVAVDNRIVLRTEWTKLHPEGIHAHHHYQSSLRRVRKMKDERLKNRRNAVHHALYGTIFVSGCCTHGS